MKATTYKKMIIVALLLFGGTFVNHSWADDGFRTIDTLELKNWMNSAVKPTLIYSLSQVEYEEQRIPGSICIPAERMQEASNLPQDRGQALVFYCKGPG